MKKIVILGCENSHANAFLDFIQKKEEFSDLEVIGVYSEDTAASQKLQEKYGVPVMASFDEAVGKVDGVIITARHGGKHYPFAKPYMENGVPMFIDKPITVETDDLVEFLGNLKKKGIKVSGGSSLMHSFGIKILKQAHRDEVGGKTVGGILRAPLSCNNPHGGFYFYSQHLVEMVMEAFGRNPKSVQVRMAEGSRTVLFNYEGFTVTGLYTESGNEYYAARFAPNGSQGGIIAANTINEAYYLEFKQYVDLLRGGEMELSYEELAAPVFALHAIEKASISGKEEPICYLPIE